MKILAKFEEDVWRHFWDIVSMKDRQKISEQYVASCFQHQRIKQVVKTVLLTNNEILSNLTHIHFWSWIIFLEYKSLKNDI